MTGYTKISEETITRRREDGTEKVFTFELLEKDGVAGSESLPITGEVMLEEGSGSDAVTKVLKTTQVTFRLKTESEITTRVREAEYRQFYLVIKEDGAVLFNGYLKEDYFDYSIFEKVQTVTVTFTGQLFEGVQVPAVPGYQTYNEFFGRLVSEIGIGRLKSFYTRTIEGRQALTDSIPTLTRVNEQELIGEAEGSLGDAVESFAGQMNWQIFQRGGRLIVADLWERVQNPGALNRYNENEDGTFSRTASENVLKTLDKTNSVRYPKGEGRVKIGRFVQQLVLRDRSTLSFPTIGGVTLSQPNLSTAISDVSDMVFSGDALRITDSFGEIRAKDTIGGAIEGTLNAFEITYNPETPGAKLWYNPGTEAWQESEAYFQHQFNLSTGGATSSYNFSIDDIRLPEVPDNQMGVMRVRALFDVTLTSGVASDLKEHFINTFAMRITEGEAPEIYRRFSAEVGNGKTVVNESYQTDLDPYGNDAVVQIFDSLAPWVNAANWQTEEGNQRIGQFSARRKARLSAGKADAIYVTVRESQGIDIFSVVDFDDEKSVRRCLPVRVQRELLSGFVDVMLVPVPLGVATESSVLSFEREEASEGSAVRAVSSPKGGSAGGAPEDVRWTDVGAKPFNTVKTSGAVGERLQIVDGELRAVQQTDENFTTNLKTKLVGLDNDADKTTFRLDAEDGFGGITVVKDTNLQFIGDGIQIKYNGSGIFEFVNTGAGTNLGQLRTTEQIEITSSTGSNTTLLGANETRAGLMRAGDWEKLEGIEAGAQVNKVHDLVWEPQFADSRGKIGTSDVGDVHIPFATVNSMGLMSDAHATKLDGIAPEADKYTQWLMGLVGGTTSPVGSGDTVRFEGGNLTTVTRDLRTISISSSWNIGDGGGIPVEVDGSQNVNFTGRENPTTQEIYIDTELSGQSVLFDLNLGSLDNRFLQELTYETTSIPGDPVKISISDGNEITLQEASSNNAGLLSASDYDFIQDLDGDVSELEEAKVIGVSFNSNTRLLRINQDGSSRSVETTLNNVPIINQENTFTEHQDFDESISVNTASTTYDVNVGGTINASNLRLNGTPFHQRAYTWTDTQTFEGGVSGISASDVGAVASGGSTSMTGPLSITSDNSGGVLRLARGSGNPTIVPASGENWMIVDGAGSGLGLNYFDDSNVIIANGGGSVGIGTTSPSYDLDVNADSGGVRIYGSFSDSTLRVRNIGHTPEGTSAYILGQSGDRIVRFRDNVFSVYNTLNVNSNTTSTDHEFRVHGGGSEAIFDGNVGIGTTSPNMPLHIHSDNSQMTFTSDTSGSNGFRVGWNGSVGQMYLFENADMRFATNNSVRMTINSSGNVGIGTTSPSYNLDVSGTIRAGQIRIQNQTLDQRYVRDSDSPTWTGEHVFENGADFLNFIHIRDGNNSVRIGQRDSSIDNFPNIHTEIIHQESGNTNGRILLADGEVGIYPNADFKVLDGNLRLYTGTAQQGMHFQRTDTSGRSFVTVDNLGRLIINYNHGNGVRFFNGTTSTADITADGRFQGSGVDTDSLNVFGESWFIPEDSSNVEGRPIVFARAAGGSRRHEIRTMHSSSSTSNYIDFYLHSGSSGGSLIKVVSFKGTGNAEFEGTVEPKGGLILPDQPAT